MPTAMPPDPPRTNDQDQEVRARMAAELTQLREQQGLSVSALARKAGLARNTVVMALRGGHSHPFTRKRLFHVLLQQQIAEPTLNPRLTLEDMEIAIAYHDASTPLRNFIAKILRTREFSTSDLRGETLTLAYQIDKMTEKEREFIRMFVAYALSSDATSDQEPTG